MRYYLAHNKVDVFHYGKIEDTQEIETGMPFLDFFSELDKLVEVLASFGVEYKGDSIDSLEPMSPPEINNF